MTTSMEAYLLGRARTVLRSIVHAERRWWCGPSDELLRDARDLLDKIEEFAPEAYRSKLMGSTGAPAEKPSNWGGHDYVGPGACIALFLLASVQWAGAATCAVPGAINLDVTQDNTATTICKSGWTKTVRPPVEYTDALKRKLLGSKYSRASMKLYELDHCIPLELGGDPISEQNLWLQPWAGKCGAHAKDKLENSLRRDVCAGRKTLAQARAAVTRWCE